MSAATTISIVLPLPAPEPRLESALAQWRGQMAPGDQILLVCADQEAMAQARALAGAASPDLLYLSLPAQAHDFAAAARAWGLSQARGEVVLFSQAQALPLPDLLSRLRQAFLEPGLAALAGAVAPEAQDGGPADLACLELIWRQSRDHLPGSACLALRRETILAGGGLDPARGDGPDLWDAWLRLERAELGARHDHACLVRLPQPATWPHLLRRALDQGRGLFQGRRLGAGSTAPPDRPVGQVMLVMAALVVFAALWGPAPDRAWSLSLICLLLLYPFNRAFLRFAAQEEPAQLGSVMLFCLLRPWFWGAGMLAAALARLTGRGGKPTISC